MATFYAGQTDYIDKLNTLASAQDLVDINTALSTLNSSLTTAQNAATTATNQATTATTQATLAKDWATKLGSTVDGTDYSSKYYSQAAASSASDALTRALNAQDWAIKLGSTVNGTEYSAKYHAQAASSSATTATNQATTATNQATIATNQATTATNQATTATNQATTATTQATLAKDWATKLVTTVDGADYSAKYHAQAAANSATTATNQATTATNQATTATTQATLAKDWATKLVTTVDGTDYSAKYHAQAAANSATTANNWAITAGNSATTAQNWATTAGNSATTAQNWAIQLGSPVSAGEYSAKYWAQQAQSTVGNGLVYKGNWAANTGSYPANPATGHYYRVSIAGTVSSILYNINDAIIYNGTGWDKIDNSAGGVTGFSAGSTGFTPNTTTTGSITLAGTLNIANGGTGATTAANALTNLGAQPADGDLSAIAALTGTNGFLKKTAVDTWSLDTNTYITSSGSVSGTAGGLSISDSRTISPSTHSLSRLTFGFTSWANNNATPYADFLHFRSWGDSSGGNDNLLTFRKDALGLRLWQQTWGSATAYSSYKDIAWTDGTNATGTWAISITGNAGTVTNGIYTTSSFNLGTTSIALNRISGAQTLTGISIDGNAGTVTNGIYTTSSFNLGTTSIALNRASGSQTLTGISIDGNAGTVTNGIYTTSSFNLGTTSIALNRASGSQSLTGVSIDGNAGTATKWATSRTVTFTGGDITGSFIIDGSADVNNVSLTSTTGGGPAFSAF